MRFLKLLLNYQSTLLTHTQTQIHTVLTLSLQPLLSSYFVSMWMENLGRNEHCGINKILKIELRETYVLNTEYHGCCCFTAFKIVNIEAVTHLTFGDNAEGWLAIDLHLNSFYSIQLSKGASFFQWQYAKVEFKSTFTLFMLSKLLLTLYLCPSTKQKRNF